MVHQCYFKHCKQAQTKHCKFKFHKFPSDEPTLQKWIEIIGKPPKVHSKVCSKHFKKSDYKINPKALRPSLKPTAVPCKNLTAEQSQDRKPRDRFDSDYEENCSDDTMSFASSDEDNEPKEEDISEEISNRVMCRACLRESDTDNDFESLMTDTNEMYYTNLTNIEVHENDYGSKLICSKCQLLLANFHSFKETCLKSNQFFIDQWNSNSSSTIKLEISIQSTDTAGEFVACDYNTEEIDLLQENLQLITEKSDHKTDIVPVNEELLILESERVIAKQPSPKKKKPSLDTTEKKIKYKKILEEKGCIQCPFCPKQFLKINTFYKHKRDHLHTYMCSLCGKQYASQRSLTIHFQFIHTDERKYKCDLCGHAFKAKASLIDHMETRHNNSRNYVCDRCSSAFKSKKSLHAHVRLVHSNLEAKFECSQCDKKFKKKSYLVTHEQLHTGHKLYICQICEKSFTTKNSRDRHQERHTTNDHRPYQCRLCFNTFKRSKYHNRHTKKFHPDEPELPAIRLPLQVTGLTGKNDGDSEILDGDGVIVKTEGDNHK